MKSYHFDYDRTYNPPAPVISARLRSERGGVSAPLPAFVDSGADATMVPIAILEQIRAPFEDTRNLVGLENQIFLNAMPRIGGFFLVKIIAGAAGGNLDNQFGRTL